VRIDFRLGQWANERRGDDRRVRSLVTGGAGFIGSHVVDALAERGHEVVVADDLSTGRETNIEAAIDRGVDLVVGDIRDAGFVDELVRGQRPELVFHLAAQIDVRVSVSRPRMDADVNVAGTINVLEAARRSAVRRFVFASTGGAIYGEGTPPLAERGPIRPISPYGQAKHAAEGYCDLYRRLHGVSTINLRLGNVYGPRQDPLGEGGVIAIFCGRLLSGERPVVYGDGRQTRDYVYVGDVADAVLVASASDAHGAYNVGRGKETTVLELVERLRKLGGELGVPGGSSFEPEFAPERQGEIRRSALDPGKARAELGFEAGTALDQGLRRTLHSLGEVGGDRAAQRGG
jgi:UDP-glucose 4-epimerase